MKKVVFLMFALLAVFIAPVFSQVEAPADIFQWVGALPLYLGSFWGVAVSLPFLTAIVIGLTNSTDRGKAVKYVITGVVTLALLLLAYFLSFGYLHGSYWWWIAVNFVGLMVIEILGYSVPMIKAVLDAIAEKFNPWKPKPAE